MNFVYTCFLLGFLATSIASDAEVSTTPKPSKCLGEIVPDVSEDFIKKRDKCWSKYYNVPFNVTIESTEDTSCVAVCLMQEHGMISADFKFVKSEILAYAKTVFPPKVSEEMGAAWSDCIDKEGQMFQLKSGNCSSINPIFVCTASAYRKICEKE